MAIEVTVKVYVVVDAGLAVGCAAVVELNPVAGDHEYVNPITPAVPITIVGVEQVVVPSAPAFAVGRGCTTMVTSDTLVQPAADVPVTV